MTKQISGMICLDFSADYLQSQRKKSKKNYPNSKKFVPSLGSVDELAALDDDDETSKGWQEELGDRMMEITERKKSSFAGREEAFAAYIQILSAKYAKEEIYSKKTDLIDSMARSIKNGRTEKEGILAAKGRFQCLHKLPNNLKESANKYS